MSVQDDGALPAWPAIPHGGKPEIYETLATAINRRRVFVDLAKLAVPHVLPDADGSLVELIGAVASGQTPKAVRDMFSAMQTGAVSMQASTKWCDSDGTPFSGFNLTARTLEREKLGHIILDLRRTFEDHRYKGSILSGRIIAFINMHEPIPRETERRGLHSCEFRKRNVADGPITGGVWNPLGAPGSELWLAYPNGEDYAFDIEDVAGPAGFMVIGVSVTVDGHVHVTGGGATHCTGTCNDARGLQVTVSGGGHSNISYPMPWTEWAGGEAGHIECDSWYPYTCHWIFEHCTAPLTYAESVNMYVKIG